MSKGDVLLKDKNSFHQLNKFPNAIPVGNIIYQYKEGTLSVIYFNEMMREIIGCSHDECNTMLEENPWGFICNEDMEDFHQLFEDLITHEKQLNYKCRLRGKNDTRNINLSAKIVEKDGKGIIVNCVIVYSDRILEHLKVGVNNRSFNIDYKEIESLPPWQIDQVTGVYSRDAFKEVSINNFNKINDILGYSYGDKLLKSIAENIRLSIDDKGIIGRLSGTKFLIYLYNNQDMTVIKDKLELIKDLVKKEVEGSVEFSIHMGLSQYIKDGNTYNELYKKANTALYKARELGKNGYVFYSQALEKTNSNRIQGKKKVISKERKVEMRTFGYFDVFVDGKAILIFNAKAKELLALLVHRRGGFVTPGEIIAHLWEDEDANQLTMARCRKTFKLLRDTLKEYGVEYILESNKGARRVITEKVNCDLYCYLSGDNKPDDFFKSLYMLNYSWGELYMSELQEQAERLKSLAK